MRTVVITGGTNGIGRGLALRRLRDGDRVIAVGSSAARGQALHAEAARLDAAGRFTFIQADLSSVARTTALAGELRAAYPVIDVLVLCAYRYNPERLETSEGLERTFALYAVSRYLLAEQLRPSLERADRPAILNLCGTGGVPTGSIHWDDLQLRRGYTGFRATMQGARVNDLLGVGFQDRDPVSAIRYLLYNPLFVDTGLEYAFTQPTKTVVKVMAALFAAPIDKALAPIVELLADPPAERLVAYRTRKRVDLSRKEFDRASALRLYGTLAELTGAYQRR